MNKLIRDVITDLVAGHSTPPSEPVVMQHQFEHGEIVWNRGDKFNYRLWAALVLVDPTGAKTYFRTTS